MNYLILVNKNNKIKNSYINKLNLIKTKDINNNEIQVEEKTYNNYLELKDYLLTKNICIGIDTAYRTEEEQEEIIKYYFENYGKEYVDKYVAPPSYSEHHTGLCIDLNININGKYCNDDLELFKLDSIFRIIQKELYKFGFILRYPEGKEELTGYNYEPWHIRYVGKIPAKIIYENNLCLEEYLNSFGGVLVVNKEKNMTSFNVVQQVSKILGIKKIGHTGTLDPLAEGVLVLTIGKYTKLGEDLTSLDKTYIATAIEKIETDTLDITGKIINKNNNTINNLETTLNSFKKTYLQEVPKYSAIKVKGKKLYEYARENIEVELPKKEVTIKDIKLLNKENDEFTFLTNVTKGTYIRSLIRDIGKSSNTLLTMSKLIRIRQGKFKIEDSYTLEQIKNGQFKLLSIEDVLDYKIIEINKELYKKIDNGVPIENTYKIDDKVIFKYNNKLIAVYKKDGNLLKMDTKLV